MTDRERMEVKKIGKGEDRKIEKYYDWSRHRILSKDDGCRYEDWEDSSENFSFALHPEGFSVFLPPSELKESDEYQAGDPYTVETDIKSEFHKRRIDSTIYLLNLALDKSGPAPRILDIGCGEGHITSEIRKDFHDAEVSGLDHSISAVNRAAASFPGIDFCVADACSPPYCRDYFDVVVCNNLWEHAPSPLLLLRGIRRILRSGGSLIVSTPSRYRFSNIMNILRGRQVVLMSKEHVTEYSVGQVIEQMKRAGFEVKEVYSRPLHSRPQGIKSLIASRMILPVMRAYLKITGSDHVLESTAFFLAEKP